MSRVAQFTDARSGQKKRASQVRGKFHGIAPGTTCGPSGFPTFSFFVASRVTSITIIHAVRNLSTALADFLSPNHNTLCHSMLGYRKIRARAVRFVLLRHGEQFLHNRWFRGCRLKSAPAAGSEVVLSASSDAARPDRLKLTFGLRSCCNVALVPLNRGCVPEGCDPEMSKLVIVESAAKAKTINKYLGKEYKVRASLGHVRDLPKSKMGVDIEHDFAPDYVVIADRKKILTELKKLAKDSDEVFLATDLDREGEAIAWHLAIGAEAPERENPPRRFQRDHPERDPRGVPEPVGRQRQQGERAAGAADPRPHRRLPAQPAALEQSPARALRRPRPVGGRPPDRRARAGDREVQAAGILGDRRRSRAAQAATPASPRNSARS